MNEAGSRTQLYKEFKMKKVMLAGAYICFSIFNSWALATWADSVGSRVGAVDKCKKCKESNAKPRGECTHLGLSDPCSKLTCIKNIEVLPNCPIDNGSSGKADCPHELRVTPGVQTVHDMDCSSETPWKQGEVQKAVPPCTPGVYAQYRCLQECDGPLAFPGADVEAYRCKKP